MTGARRLPYLDGLRGIGVLALLFAGQGMQLFFILSGMCLAYPALLELRKGRMHFDVARYAAHRIVRIVPVYYAAVVLLAILFISVNYRVTDVSIANIARQMAFLDRNAAFFNPWFWSVSVLIRWYVLFPVALWLWVRAPKAYVAVFVLLAIAYETRAQSADLAALPAFLLGIIAADLLVKYTVPRLVERVLSVAPVAFIGTASFSMCLLYAPIVQLLQSHGIPPLFCAAAGVAAGLAFWCVVERTCLSSAVRNRWSAAIEPVIRMLLARFGIGDRIVLERPATQEPAALAEAS
jgi:peptidoglycan/LPS O-acetylase OafA/YrhL